MRNFYRKCCEPTGTLEHWNTDVQVQPSKGVPEFQSSTAQQQETGTLEHREGVALFVAPTLASWATSEPRAYARDVQINDTAYRRLDAEYYAWLRSRMNRAKSAHQAGHIDAEAYEALRVAFNAVHDWAMQHFGEAALSDAIRGLDARDYRPPVPEADTATGRNGRAKPIASAYEGALALVDAIAERALAIGWKRERLYSLGGRGVFDPSRGLVCYLKAGDRIGEVTAQSIEIIHTVPTEVRHRFYNPDVDQPWIRRAP